MRSAFCMVGMAIAALPLMEALPLMDERAHAAEAATGVYIVGSRGPNVGIMPPAGVYFQDDTYFYSGSEIAAGKAIKAKF
jgi:hypothetical protein